MHSSDRGYISDKELIGGNPVIYDYYTGTKCPLLCTSKIQASVHPLDLRLTNAVVFTSIINEKIFSS